ncbi:hypothetical protein LTR62_008847 [Meristemomyces frigidus]|uniref:Folic acid synthesis protein FOL1 n=1 Tax=Meristemomyces frigidus TaxID=1508187 RepID=A0AAN7YCC6_9PEZI|nr:hypothetical protein LTR62_008847 [Meristemomyces frigidus]
MSPSSGGHSFRHLSTTRAALVQASGLLRQFRLSSFGRTSIPNLPNNIFGAGTIFIRASNQASPQDLSRSTLEAIIGGLERCCQFSEPYGLSRFLVVAETLKRSLSHLTDFSIGTDRRPLAEAENGDPLGSGVQYSFILTPAFEQFSRPSVQIRIIRQIANNVRIRHNADYPVIVHLTEFTYVASTEAATMLSGVAREVKIRDDIASLAAAVLDIMREMLPGMTFSQPESVPTLISEALLRALHDHLPGGTLARVSTWTKSPESSQQSFRGDALHSRFTQTAREQASDGPPEVAQKASADMQGSSGSWDSGSRSRKTDGVRGLWLDAGTTSEIPSITAATGCRFVGYSVRWNAHYAAEAAHISNSEIENLTERLATVSPEVGFDFLAALSKSLAAALPQGACVHLMLGHDVKYTPVIRFKTRSNYIVGGTRMSPFFGTWDRFVVDLPVVYIHDITGPDQKVVAIWISVRITAVQSEATKSCANRDVPKQALTSVFAVHDEVRRVLTHVEYDGLNDELAQKVVQTLVDKKLLFHGAMDLLCVKVGIYAQTSTFGRAVWMARLIKEDDVSPGSPIADMALSEVHQHGESQDATQNGSAPVPQNRSDSKQDTDTSIGIAGLTLPAHTDAVGSYKHEQGDLVIALGSNIGNRLESIEAACRAIDRDPDMRITRTSSLYESKPMYVEDQDRFLNGVCQVQTSLEPIEVLNRLQAIEQQLGRVKLIDKGPRNIDLDIVLYGDTAMQTDRLTIPHALFKEREFVLRPLMDLHLEKHPLLGESATVHLKRLGVAAKPSMYPQVPLGPQQTTVTPGLPGRTTRVMSILNVTPDSFSDGGDHNPAEPEAVRAAILSQIASGAAIIDIGGQSSRPNAPDVTAAEELARILPAIAAIKSLPEADNIAISIDTYRSSVARAAINAGAHIINDISAGMLDDEMLPTIAELGCTYIMMHMRGTPATMQSTENLQYPNGLMRTIASELKARLDAAQDAGIRRWRIILDPGLGFSKTVEQNLTILRKLLDLVDSQTLGLRGMPWLVGSSRKGFIGKVVGVDEPKQRAWGTAATVTTAVQHGADIVRVHDVEEMVQVVKMSDAIYRHHNYDDVT